MIHDFYQIRISCITLSELKNKIDIFQMDMMKKSASHI